MNAIELTVVLADSDDTLQFGIRLSSYAHALYHETFLYPRTLMAFATGLMSFPQATNSEVTMESGSKDPRFSDYIRLRAFVLTPTGHSAIEVESQLRGTAPRFAESHFFIPGLPADFKRAGAEIANWLKAPHEPLRVEWKNG